MQSLREDLLGELPKVRRKWIRLPVTLMLYVFVVIPIDIIGGAAYGIAEWIVSGWKHFLLPCWRGEDEQTADYR